jgi:hypothetical protein
MATQPTTIAVAAPIAVTRRSRSASSRNHTVSVHAGASSVLVKARMLGPPVL